MLTVISFIFLFVSIRISGKRTLAKFNAFDFIVTVALGSTLTYMMLAQVAYVEGAVVLMLIIGLQYLFAKLARTSDTMEGLLNASPTLLFYKGKYIRENMKREVVTREEVYGAIRKEGVARISDVLAVVIEPNGELSVIVKSGIPEGASSLDDLDFIKDNNPEQ